MTCLEYSVCPYTITRDTSSDAQIARMNKYRGFVAGGTVVNCSRRS